MNQRSKIAILGFGVEGKSVFEYLLKHKYDEITVCDQNVNIKDEMPNGVSVRLGPHYLNDLTDFEVIFRSPGIRYLDPNVQNAVANGVFVTSSIGFFMDQCPCPVIGITGTKGKGTTASLIYEMLKKAGKSVYLGGNIGNPAIDFLDDLNGDDLAVLELSSFQLQDIKKSPRYTVLLNTTVDHLDYHADEGEYLKAKESILAHQSKDSVAVLNRDYPYVEHYEPLVQGEKRLVSVETKVEDGAFVNDGEIFHATYGDVEKICDVKDMALTGSHNLENVLPAIAICKELGIDNEPIVEVIKEFAGLPHRLELVKEVNSVRYYNDSYSTTPETSMAAVDSFDEPTVLIAGGSDKGADFGQWALKVLTKPSLESVVLMGDTAEKMEQAIFEAKEKLGEAEGSPTKVFRAGDLTSALDKAASNAVAGGVVVMSPASASFDAFENYKQRGATFRKLVKEL